LKLRFDDNGADEVHASYTVAQKYQGYPGVVHGGIVAAMLDEIGGRTTMAGERQPLRQRLHWHRYLRNTCQTPVSKR
jgi:hypothetical protein